MSSKPYSIHSLAVGDYVAFERCFTPQDFAAFSAISGDTNALHHDPERAAMSIYGEPIVPLHLTLSPLSMIAGMALPGEPSLYLGHEVRAIAPVLYGQTLCYSARVEAVNLSHRILTLRVLAVHGASVVLDATMRVRCLTEEWGTAPALPIRNSERPGLAVITGGTGDIGGALALRLAKSGWRLLLQDRGPGERRARLEKHLQRLNADTAFLTADLSTESGRAALASSVAGAEDLGLLLHTASPGVDAPLDALVGVNYKALRQTAEAALPRLLSRQRGAVVMLSTIAAERPLSGWEDYAAVKNMAAGFVDNLERSYSAYGVRGLTFMPGLVATRFSDAFRGKTPALAPEEVAEAVLAAVGDLQAKGNTIALDVSSMRRGHRGFHTVLHESPGADPAEQQTTALHVTDAEVNRQPERAAVIAVLQKCLRCKDASQLTEARLGQTPGWDSLKHIEILLSLERTLGLRFASGEIESTHSAPSLEALCRKKLAEKGIR